LYAKYAAILVTIKPGIPIPIPTPIAILSEVSSEEEEVGVGVEVVEDFKEEDDNELVTESKGGDEEG
jgi:hypothetical protein